MRWLCAILSLVALPAGAEPAPPTHDLSVAKVQVGVFCALRAMNQRPAPGTISGWVHVPDGPIDFHWPDRQVVPASLGLAFGVKARLQPGLGAVPVEMRVFRPGLDRAEIWDSVVSDSDDGLNFFRFDDESELLAGPWRLEAWEGSILLYTAEFEVVPASAVPEIAQACGATS